MSSQLADADAGWEAALGELREFASLLHHAFDAPVYLVGSAHTKSHPKDVDVAVILPRHLFRRLFVERTTPWNRLYALTAAFDALGQKMTGLRIDLGIVSEDRPQLGPMTRLDHGS